MNFKIHPNVMTAKNGGPMRHFVGYKLGATTPEIKYTIGRFGFANAVSATVFAYLNHHPKVTQQAAKMSVVGIEQLISKTGALAKLNSLSVSSVVNMVLPYGKLLEVGTKLTGFAGSAYMKTKIQSSHLSIARKNPYIPASTMTWTGNMTDEYVEYAVAFWKIHPKEGPAYQLA